MYKSTDQPARNSVSYGIGERTKEKIWGYCLHFQIFFSNRVIRLCRSEGKDYAEIGQCISTSTYILANSTLIWWCFHLNLWLSWSQNSFYFYFILRESFQVGLYGVKKSLLGDNGEIMTLKNLNKKRPWHSLACLEGALWHVS